MTASLQVRYNTFMAKHVVITGARIESQPPRDDYQRYFQMGQIAANLSEKAADPNGTFRRIMRLGVAANKESTPQTRVLRWTR